MPDVECWQATGDDNNNCRCWHVVISPYNHTDYDTRFRCNRQLWRGADNKSMCHQKRLISQTRLCIHSDDVVSVYLLVRFSRAFISLQTNLVIVYIWICVWYVVGTYWMSAANMESTLHRLADSSPFRFENGKCLQRIRHLSVLGLRIIRTKRCPPTHPIVQINVFRLIMNYIFA